MKGMQQVKKAVCVLLAGCAGLTVFGCGENQSMKCKFGNVAIGGGGYIPGIVYSKGEKGLRYCRTDIGGAYRWSSKDTQWVPITDHLGGVNSDNWNLIGIESIAADPVETNRVYLSCGTYMNSNGAILASEDYGETWTQVDMPFAMGGNQSGRGVGERLMVNPKNNRQIFCGTRTDGLYVSEDYGKTWNKNTAFPLEGDYVQEKNQIGVMWEEFDPQSNDLYVGVAMKDGTCIYRSKDAGKSFEALPAFLPGMYPLQAEISANGWLYLCYSDSCGPNAQVTAGAVARYDMKNNVFEEITPDIGNGKYGFSGISVDGSDPNVIVCGTLGFWSENGENLYRSTDGGVTWTPFFTAEKRNYVMDVSEAAWLNWGRDSAQTGWWMADVEIDPFNSDVVSWGTGATLYSTKNLTALGSETPVTIAFDAFGIEETAVFKVVSTPVENGSPELYSIMGDLTGFAHQSADIRPDDSHFMKNGVSADLAVAWNNGNIAVYTNDSNSSIHYTTDGGATWQDMPQPVLGSSGKLAVSADGKIVMWTPSALNAQVYFTDDLGETWYICGGLSRASFICADKRDSKTFYAISGGSVYVSRDGCVHFQQTGLNVADNCEIVPSAEKDGFVWIRSGTSLGFSEDYAASMTYVKGISANAIGVGKAKKDGKPMALYIMGTWEGANGIFMTDDHGKTWKRLTSKQDCFGNLTPSITGDATTYGKFYFATNGRGIIKGEIES